MPRRSRVAAALLAVVSPLSAMLRAGECPTSLAPDGGALGYRDRGGRCEGFYVAKLSGGNLELVSLTVGPPQYALSAQTILEVSAPPGARGLGSSINVRAVAIPAATYYQLDARIRPDETLTWPAADVLLPAGLSASRVGLFGWLDGTSRPTYVPLILAARGSTPRQDRSIRIRARTGASLSGWRWRAWHDPAGRTTPAWKEVRARVSAGSALSVDFAEATGEWWIDIKGRIERADEWSELSINVWMPPL